MPGQEREREEREEEREIGKQTLNTAPYLSQFVQGTNKAKLFELSQQFMSALPRLVPAVVLALTAGP